MLLENKTAVITGAAGDVGLATMRAFLAEGARTMLLDIDGNALDKATAEIEGGKAHSVATDVTSGASVSAAARAAADKFGKIDILFANAGREQVHYPIVDLPEELFDRVTGVNIKGVYLTVKHFLPIMNDGGSIVLTGSVAGITGFPSLAAYSASKAALIGMMRPIVLEGAPRGIRCNVVHPGSVKSRMLDRSAQEFAQDGDTTEFYKKAAAMVKLGRLVEPAEIADLVVFLGSDRSRMITGQSIAVDGGTVL